MKHPRTSLILIILFSLFFSSTCKEGEKKETFVPAMVVYAKGDTKVKLSNGEAKTIKAKDLLNEGDTIITGAKSKAALQIKGWGVIRLAQKSELVLTSVSKDADAVFDLKKGRVYNNVIKQIKKRSYTVRSPTSVAAVRGTKFGLVIAKKKDKIMVGEGLVAVSTTGSDKQTEVAAGKTAILATGKKVKVRKIKKKESKELSILDSIPYLDSLFGGGDDTDKHIEKIKEQEDAAGEAKAEPLPKTLPEIKAKYGTISQVDLFNGQILKGAILKKGKIWSILTTKGIKKIKKADIKGSKPIN